MPPASREQRMIAAMKMVTDGHTYRQAAERHQLPKSTIASRIQAASPSSQRVRKLRAGLRTLTSVEEELVLNLITRSAERGLPLTRSLVKEAVEIIISRMTPASHLALRFKGGTPGTRYLRNFHRRHRDKILFCKALRQEAVRFQSCNGDVLTTHFARLEKIIQEHNIDGPRIWNCDETGATPGRDANGKQTSRVYVTRAGARDAKIGHFLSTNRVTMLPAVSADGKAVPPMFVFKGSRLPYRVLFQEGIKTVQTYTDCLPRGCIVSMRSEGGGVDTKKS